MNRSYSKIIHIQESNMRLERRVINEKTGEYHSMDSLADALTPHGFRKSLNNTPVLGPNGEFNGLYKGYDENKNGVKIHYNLFDSEISLSVHIDGYEKLYREYSITAPDYIVDDEKILKDLGIYKTYEFKVPLDKL